MNEFVFVANEERKKSETTEERKKSKATEERKKSETTEEIFERRLAESLNQMVAMGFDNDADWLKQLLIAKDLNISKVLDALNPPKL